LVVVVIFWRFCYGATRGREGINTWFDMMHDYCCF
jgi:hypothetical protein